MSDKRKWWLAVALICCVAPATFADHDHCDRDHHRDCRHQQMPEGGSTAIYLLGAGLTCVGAMFLRSKIAKPTHS